MLEITFPSSSKAHAIGACIYCGDAAELTDEHVVPYGLAKNSLVLPEASCRKCAALTSRIEMGVLRDGMGILREKFGSPTRRGRKRTGKAHRWVIDRGSDGRITPAGHRCEFSMEHLPAICVLPEFNPAREVAAPGHDTGWTGRFWIWRENFDATGLLRPGTALHLAKCNPEQFARFLAKIAHGVAIAELGLHGFRPFLKEVILKDDVDPFQYVGGAGIPDATEGVLHAWEQGFAERAEDSGTRYVIVLIRLFAFLGAPQYIVVAGDQPVTNQKLAG